MGEGAEIWVINNESMENPWRKSEKSVRPPPIRNGRVSNENALPSLIDEKYDGQEMKQKRKEKKDSKISQPRTAWYRGQPRFQKQSK